VLGDRESLHRFLQPRDNLVGVVELFIEDISEHL
jgi:hypothetical protein